MKSAKRILLTALLFNCTVAVSAQTMRPGLWEVSGNVTSRSGEMEKANAEMKKQIASMPPEQRRTYTEMIGKMGGSVGPGGVSMKMCISEKMAANNDWADPTGNCKQTNLGQTGNTIKFAVVCTKPASSGEGQFTIMSREAYTMSMTSINASNGKVETTSSTGTGKFVSADCGNIKPPQ